MDCATFKLSDFRMCIHESVNFVLLTYREKNKECRWNFQAKYFLYYTVAAYCVAVKDQCLLLAFQAASLSFHLGKHTEMCVS